MTAPSRPLNASRGAREVGGLDPDGQLPTFQQVTSPPRRPPRRSRPRIVGLYLLTVYLLATLIFLLPRALPGDPFRALVDEYTEFSPETRAALEKTHGLDGSLPQQYVRYLSRLAHRDLGQSITSSQPVTRLIRYHLPWTLLLTGSALLLSTVISFRMGLAAAWRRNSSRDRVLQVSTSVLRAVPEYAIAMFLLIAFAVVIKVFPVAGGSTPFTASESAPYKIADVIWHLILPLTALTVGLIGTKFLMVRNVTIGVLGQDYMLLARAKGLPEQIQRRHHAGRNVMLPYLNLIGAQVGVAIGGGVFVQQIFGYPGIGNLMVQSINNRDFPVIEGCFLILSLLVLTANLLVDLAGSFIDPRARPQ